MSVGGVDINSVNNNHPYTTNLNNNGRQNRIRENYKDEGIRKTIKEILGWLNKLNENKIMNNYHQRYSNHREDKNKNIINHTHEIDTDYGRKNKKGEQLQLGHSTNRCKNFKEKLDKGGSDQVSVKIRILNVQGFSDIKYMELKDRFLGGIKNIILFVSLKLTKKRRR